MKTLTIITFFLCITTSFAQSKINVLDENVNSKHPIVIIEKLDGSVFELNGKSVWTVHRLMPSSAEFARLVNAKRPLKIEYETISGHQYTTTNGGQWKKEQRIYEPQAPMGFTANYKRQQKVIEAMFTMPFQSSVEIHLHSVYGETVFTLYNSIQQLGQHKLLLPVTTIPRGEYMLVLKTPQKVETVRISIMN